MISMRVLRTSSPIAEQMEGTERGYTAAGRGPGGNINRKGVSTKSKCDLRVHIQGERERERDMYMYIHIYVHVNIYIYTYKYQIITYIYIYTYTYTCTCMHAYCFTKNARYWKGDATVGIQKRRHMETQNREPEEHTRYVYQEQGYLGRCVPTPGIFLELPVLAFPHSSPEQSLPPHIKHLQTLNI